jgi:hypothetical protein
MRRNPRLFRLTATVAMTALLCDAVLPLAAVAQPAPPPLPAPGQGRPDINQGDPPARVGRIAGMTGTVSFHNEGDTDWSAASLNYPVSSGNAFWTEPSANARLEISDSRVVLGGETEFDVTTLDASGLQGVVPQGETYIHLRDLAPNEAWSIQTPRGLVRLSGQGRYGIAVGTTEQPTLITVIDGAAQIDGPGVSLQIAANQTATITGTDTFQGSVGPAVRDAFLTAQLDAERPPPAAAVPIPAQVATMAGGSDLVGTGSWSDAPEYGRVWYPPVAATWVPYREGHWAYVAPWGWTWIDDASWGFAPFHYGRWIQIGGRWAWTPGAVVATGRPVYAPALVTFIGVGAGVALGAAIASGSIGWVPLGPREPFRPWYHASPRYVREMNITHVTNINTTDVRINNYVNRGAATSIPAAAMRDSRPVRDVARPVTAQEFAAARPIMGQQPLRPTAATAGVTPAVARRLDLGPAAGGVRPAPGPAVRPVAAGAAGFARPAFPSARPGLPGAAGEPGRPGSVAPGVRPADVTTPQSGRPGEDRRPADATPRPALQPGTRPEGQPGVPGRPGEPVRPDVRPGAPVGPGVRPETSARPDVRPGGQPEVRPGVPVGPGVRPETPVRPETRPGAPVSPGGQPEVRPGVPVGPGVRPETPVRPETRPGATVSPGGQPEVRPGMPVGPGVRPETPVRPEIRPGATVSPGVRPEAPVRPEIRPAAPARPEIRPAAPMPVARPTAPMPAPAAPMPAARPAAPMPALAAPMPAARPAAPMPAPAAPMPAARPAAPMPAPRPAAPPPRPAPPAPQEHRKAPGER